MSFAETMKIKAKGFGNRIVLPEGSEARTVQDACILKDEKSAYC